MTYVAPFLRSPAGGPLGEGAGTDLSAALSCARDARSRVRHAAMSACVGEHAPSRHKRVERVVPPISPVKLFHAPSGIALLAPARPPRMTGGADGDAELRDRRAGGIGRATRTHNRCCTIGGMSRSLHGLLLSHCCWVGCSVWPALRADHDGAESRCPHGQRGACALGLRRSGTVRGSSRLTRLPTEHGRTV